MLFDLGALITSEVWVFTLLAKGCLGLGLGGPSRECWCGAALDLAPESKSCKGATGRVQQPPSEQTHCDRVPQPRHTEASLISEHNVTVPNWFKVALTTTLITGRMKTWQVWAGTGEVCSGREGKRYLDISRCPWRSEHQSWQYQFLVVKSQSPTRKLPQWSWTEGRLSTTSSYYRLQRCKELWDRKGCVLLVSMLTQYLTKHKDIFDLTSKLLFPHILFIILEYI